MATCNACGADRHERACPFCGQRSRVRDTHPELSALRDSDDDARNADRIDRSPVYDPSPLWNVDRIGR